MSQSITLDSHTHLENGPLTIDYAMKFIDVAHQKGIQHLHILDHTHRFFEWKEMYQAICAIPEQKAWFEKKQKNSIDQYHQLIEQLKQMNLPIKVSFGLEVCYRVEDEAFIQQQLSRYPYDFVVGSIHSINGILYDMGKMSIEHLWNKMNHTTIFKTYYHLIEQAILSGLFTQIGHPDTIKMYQYDPGYDLIPTYLHLAKLAKKHQVAMEDNTGAHYRYHHPDVGLATPFRQALLQEGVQIQTASDAHVPNHVGMCFNELAALY